MKKAAGNTGSIRGSLSALAMGLVFASSVAATAQEAKPVSLDLTPKLYDLLRQEMISIEDASQQILSALVAGEDARVAELAQKIHDSFIMEQSMAPEDEKDLMAALPDDFVSRDRAFHQLSADLAEAARNGDRAEQHEKFGEMIEACTTCHALYATDRFLGLAE